MGDNTGRVRKRDVLDRRSVRYRLRTRPSSRCTNAESPNGSLIPWDFDALRYSRGAHFGGAEQVSRVS